ncbi:MAG: TonB family protein [Bacteroidota bacterium]
MPVAKTPQADLRRRYPRYQQIGLALSLGLVILAFTVPVAPSAPEAVLAQPNEPEVWVDIPPTVELPPPPPPPPAPPPPVEVADDQEVEETLYDLVLDPEAALPLPSTPPVAPSVTPPTPVDPPDPPAANEDTDEGFVLIPDVQPELIGGLAALQSRVEYPEMARRVGIEGQVVVQFVVDERGTVVDPVVLRSPNDLLSEAAVKAVQESRFTPGQQRGRPVKVRFAVPVTFRLR